MNNDYYETRDLRDPNCRGSRLFASIANKISSIKIREVNGQEGEMRIITGTAIVFNVESCVLDSNGTPFREIIKPEAAQMTFLRSQDIKLNLLHNRKDTIARSRMGQGNLKISVDREGVKFEAVVPKCDIGDRAIEMVRSGVYTGCSFEFTPDVYDIEDRGANKEVRVIHKRFKRIYAFTLGMDPAYLQTWCNVRELRKKAETGRHMVSVESARRAQEMMDMENELSDIQTLANAVSIIQMYQS